MNKAELINSVAAAADVSKKEAEAVVSATFDAITAALKDGDKVQLVGFGSFEVKKRAARVGRLRGARVQGRQGPEGRRGEVIKAVAETAGTWCRQSCFPGERRQPCVWTSTSRSPA